MPKQIEANKSHLDPVSVENKRVLEFYTAHLEGSTQEPDPIRDRTIAIMEERGTLLIYRAAVEDLKEAKDNESKSMKRESLARVLGPIYKTLQKEGLIGEEAAKTV